MVHTLLPSRRWTSEDFHLSCLVAQLQTLKHCMDDVLTTREFKQHYFDIFDRAKALISKIQAGSLLGSPRQELLSTQGEPRPTQESMQIAKWALEVWSSMGEVSIISEIEEYLLVLDAITNIEESGINIEHEGLQRFEQFVFAFVSFGRSQLG